jgi:hypothetical protein
MALKGGWWRPRLGPGEGGMIQLSRIRWYCCKKRDISNQPKGLPLPINFLAAFALPSSSITNLTNSKKRTEN